MRPACFIILFTASLRLLAAETVLPPATSAQFELVFNELSDSVAKIRESKRLYQQGKTKEAAGLLLDYFRSRDNVKWHFDRRDKERLIADYRKLYPDQAADDLEYVDSLLNGKWLQFNKYWNCGFPPRWNEETDESEYTEVLNRHPFLVNFGRAYWLTGDEKYTRGVMVMLTDWIENIKSPPDKEIHWDYPAWGELQVALRGRNWPSAWEFFIDSPGFSPDFLVRFLYGLIQQKDYLREVAPKSGFATNADHNHYIMNMEGLFDITVMFPEFKSAVENREFAMKELERCRRNQVLSDGVHIEETPGYHEACIWIFAAPMLLGDMNGCPLSDFYKDGIKKMFYFLNHIARPDLTLTPFGDTQVHEITETLGLGEMLFSEPVSVHKGTSGERLFWLTNGKAFKHGDKAADLPLLGEFPVGGFYCMRSSWDRDALYLAFRNGKRRRIGGAHVHADHLAIDLSAFGTPLIVDPGVYTYTDGPWREHFKSTEAKNTISIDGKSSMEYRSSWQWGPDPEVGEGSFQEDENGITVSTWHDGFKPVICERKITFVAHRFWLIEDQVKNLNGNRISTSYQFDTRDAQLIKGQYQGAQTKISGKDASIAVIQVKGKARATLEEGWVSRTYMLKYPAKMLRFVEDKAFDTSGALYLLIPFPPGEVQDYSIGIEGNELEVSIKGAFPFQGKLKID
ncbi:MAG TPA: alginate lyase family protein [archaeon]|nr:alginate lyase family protein [archaeon]